MRFHEIIVLFIVYPSFSYFMNNSPFIPQKEQESFMSALVNMLGDLSLMRLGVSRTKLHYHTSSHILEYLELKIGGREHPLLQEKWV